MPNSNESLSGNISYFRATYYSNFWYSRYFGSIAKDFGGNVIENDIERHKREMRLLSIFFDEIYVPRSHLITQSFDSQHKIVQAVINSNEFGYLHDLGKIRVSSFPGLDAYQDNERIVSRTSMTDSVSYPTDSGFLATIPIDRTMSVDSMKESQSNTVSFPQFAEFINNQNPELAKVYLDTLAQANIKDVPFFHESFVRLLRKALPNDKFEPIWRGTNSIYLSSGTLDYRDIISYFNDDIESIDFRFSRFGVDRYLYSFSSLYTFCSLFMEGNLLNNLLYHDIRETHRILRSDDARELVRAFRAEYQILVAGLSRTTRLPPLNAMLDQQAVRSCFELYMDGGFQRGSNTMTGILDDIAKVSKGIDPSAGLVGEALKATARMGNRFLRDRFRRRRFPKISQIMDTLSKHLKESTG